MAYLDDILIDKKLVLEFFLKFSRFEFALKLSGHALGSVNRVKADWDGFAAEIRDEFDRARSKELTHACNFYMDNPPNKQVLANGSLAWSTDLPVGPDRETELLIGLVRRVRNNLFHGGKYNAELHEETARQEQLLKGGILILEECLTVSPPVRRAYNGAAI